MSFFTHLECGFCGKEHDADKLWNLCTECSKPLLARYDTDAASKAFPKEELADRGPTLWRYREMLPVKDMEKAHIQGVLQSAGGDKTEAARLLGISRSTLYEKIKQYDL